MQIRLKTIAILFDHSIGQLRKDGNRVVGIDIWPSTRVYLDRFVQQGHTLFLLIPHKINSKDLAELQNQLMPIHLVANQELTHLFKQAALPIAGQPLIFAAIDRKSRLLAHQQWQTEVVPHFQVVPWIMEGDQVVFGMLLTSRRPDVKTTGILPYHIEKHDQVWCLLGLIQTSALPRFLSYGAVVHILPFDYRLQDCCLLKVDAIDPLAAAGWQGATILSMEKGRILLAFGDQDPDAHLTRFNAHGSLEMLMPSPELLEEPENPESFTTKSVTLAAMMHADHPGMTEKQPKPEAIDGHLFTLPSTADFLLSAQRYSGLAPLDDAGVVVSRHIFHPDNTRVVNALVEELNELGLCVFTNSFIHNGRTLKNVIADLPGLGKWRIKPEILGKILKVVEKYPRPWPWPKIEKEMQRQLGPKVYKALESKAGGPLGLKLDEMIGVYSWLPWWKLKSCMAGYGAQLVILGCHLDSSGNRAPNGYDPATDPAPGMDDNASGMSAVLLAARYLATFRGKLTHTVRFCFFNGEEAGLLGSKSYAATLKMMKSPVKAVICADMLGYNSDAQRIFEIHAGYTDPAIRDKSVPIAASVASWAAGLGVLQPAQIYQGTSVTSGAPDRNLCDPAINRSDHAAFHQQGFPAVVVTEDYFANQAGEPAKDPNPNYHTAGDTVIDADYAVSIASAIACSIKELARS